MVSCGGRHEVSKLKVFDVVIGALRGLPRVVIRMPSFNRVMSMSISTGMWKKGGHSTVSINAALTLLPSAAAHSGNLLRR